MAMTEKMCSLQEHRTLRRPTPTPLIPTALIPSALNPSTLNPMTVSRPRSKRS